MKFFKRMKDGGPESSVTGYWLIEIKSLFSIVLLKFEGPSREAYHTHAFNCWNWLIKGNLIEWHQDTTNRKMPYTDYPQGTFFKIRRDDFHKVQPLCCEKAWVLSFRGPWSKTWKEYLPNEDRYRTLTHGRKEV